MSICIEEDEYSTAFAEGNARWVVGLSNGLTVYQDDGRPGVAINSAWIRLKEYCRINSLYITSMTIGFRSNRYALESGADGYYFCKGSRGAYGMPKTIQLMFVGTLNKDILAVSCWKVPEMVKEKTEQREIAKAGECLIPKQEILCV